MAASSRWATPLSSASAPTPPACWRNMAGASRSRAFSPVARWRRCGGWICSFVIVRVQGVALLLVTLGINLVLYEAANKAYTITGGADGLARHRVLAAARHVRLRHLRPRRLHLHADRRVPALPGGAAHRAFAVRPRPEGHARELEAHAGVGRGAAPARRTDFRARPPRSPALPARCWRNRCSSWRSIPSACSARSMC